VSTSPDKEGNAMPDHQRSLTSLEIIERRFNELTAQPTSLSLDGRVIGFGLPDRLIPLDELRITLLKRQTSNQVKNAVWSEVVRRAQEQGDPWTTAALGLMMPGLKDDAPNGEAGEDEAEKPNTEIRFAEDSVGVEQR
jgi:hypothetical protein